MEQKKDIQSKRPKQGKGKQRNEHKTITKVDLKLTNSTTTLKVNDLSTAVQMQRLHA